MTDLAPPKPDCLFLRRLWADFAPAPVPTMREVAIRVAAKHGVTLDDLRSRSRLHYLNPPRQEAMALCYALGKSNQQVAEFFRRTDHTTVIHARRRHAARRGAA